ncbi:MAG: hypothetical protein LBD01_06905, partial [Puniceicoccales bacterium]|nr:hypothetical protein [Puniceicoccales bacterium]
MSLGSVSRWVRTQFAGRVFRNRDSRWNIGVSSEGAKHAATQTRGTARQSMEGLDNLIENAIWMGRDRNTKPEGTNKNIRWFHRFYVPFQVGQKRYVAKLIVKETLNGERFYDLRSGEIKTLARPTDEQGAIPPTPAPRTVSDLAEAVKRLWPADAIDSTAPRNERREKVGPRVDFANEADEAEGAEGGLDEAEKAAVLERVRGAFPWLFGNYDILLGDLNRALRERGYSGPIPDAALAARLGVSDQARRVRGERDLIVISARAWDEQGRGAALLMHEAAHAFMDRLPDATLAELREMWRKEISARTGPLYTDGELNSPLAHVEEESERGFKEWFAERVARLNAEWARARLEGRGETARVDSVSRIGRLARAFRDFMRRAWESFAGLFRGKASAGQRELFERRFRQWLVDGEVALREPRTARKARTIYGSNQADGNGDVSARADSEHVPGRSSLGRDVGDDGDVAPGDALGAFGQAKRANPDINFFDAWHGSRARFDKFRMSKVKSGQGSNTFGYGLYFASLADVARGYAGIVPGRLGAFSVGNKGEHVQIFLNGNKEPERGPLMGNHVLAALFKAYKDSDKNPRKVREVLLIRLGDRRRMRLESGPAHEGLLEALRLVEAGKVRFQKGRLPRSVYKVKIHGDKTVDELSFLDWNKPVPASMRAKVDAAVLEIYPEGVPPWFRNPEQTGGELYKALTKELGWDKQRA